MTTPIRVRAGGRLSLTNCWIRVNVTDDGVGMIGKAGRVELTHVVVDGSGFAGAPVGVTLAGGGRVAFSEFVGTTQNVRVERGAATIEWNYVHDAKARTISGDAHSYGFTVSAGGPVTIAHNWVDMSRAEGIGTGISVVSDTGPIDGVRIEGNTLLPGGSYSLYVRTDGYCRCGGVANVRVLDNHWYADATHPWAGRYGVHAVNDDDSVTAWSGNVLTRDSATVPVTFGDTRP
ncbi:hypothetical protein ACFQX7_34075 [Luedemannella flava]|uniref:hypothetical protein n=1 Tax=Luedemannella flava TaxID=349316 RepID=UPI0031D5A6EF